MVNETENQLLNENSVIRKKISKLRYLKSIKKRNLYLKKELKELEK